MNLVKRQTTLKEQLENFDKGIFIDYRGEECSCYNFYDWNCNDSTLENKAIKLYNQVKRFIKLQKDIDITQVFVKFNHLTDEDNSPYTEFLVRDCHDGFLRWRVRIKVNKVEVYKEYGGGFPLITAKNMDELVKLKKEGKF